MDRAASASATSKISVSAAYLAIAASVAALGLMIATFLQALGDLPTTPPQDLPSGVIALVGWTNRLVVLSAWTWTAAVAWHAIKLREDVHPTHVLRNANDMHGAPSA